MASNLNIDDNLLNEAQSLGNKKTKRETVNQALEEFIQRRKQKEILKVFGKIEMDCSYDYKQERKSR
ncbi:type II toxin-antitoxin system VapB family antitoxin [soil metagenome]